MIVALLVCALGFGTWLLARDYQARRRADLKRIAVDLMPNVAQRIQNFHRVKVDNGRKVWEVSAREAQYVEGEEVVIVVEPVVDVFLRDSRTVGLRGKGGKIYLKGRELQNVELDGDIDVQFGEYRLQTDHARYDSDRETIVAPGSVHITGDGFEINGERMEVDVAAQHLTLTDSVKMTLWPRT
jgi:LPS export ABC transporter protein LptC